MTDGIYLFIYTKHSIMVRVMVDQKRILGTLCMRPEYTQNGALVRQRTMHLHSNLCHLIHYPEQLTNLTHTAEQLRVKAQWSHISNLEVL